MRIGHNTGTYAYITICRYITYYVTINQHYAHTRLTYFSFRRIFSALVLFYKNIFLYTVQVGTLGTSGHVRLCRKRYVNGQYYIYLLNTHNFQ